MRALACSCLRIRRQVHALAKEHESGVLPALASRVSNVAHSYELEHEAEDPLFDGITQALDEAVELMSTNEGEGPTPVDDDTVTVSERLRRWT